MSQTIFLIAGPSGSGKTTLTQALVQRVPCLTKIVTVTTRQPRTDEISGIDYHFVTPDQFPQIQANGDLIESDHAYNESYSVPRSALDTEGDLAIIITITGALALKEVLSNSVSLFILPHDFEAAALRVAERNSPNAQARIESYATEACAARNFDQVFLNIDFEQTLERMAQFVLSRRRSLVLTGTS